MYYSAGKEKSTYIKDELVRIEFFDNEGRYSKLLIGKWKPLKQDEIVDEKELVTVDIVLKVLKGSKNFESTFLNEIKINYQIYQLLGEYAVPFYGLTIHPETKDYAMVMKHAIHGDLRKFIDKSELTWPKRVEILSKIAKSLNALHELNIIHRDFHCGNILVDDETKIFIRDFGLSDTSEYEKMIKDLRSLQELTNKVCTQCGQKIVGFEYLRLPRYKPIFENPPLDSTEDSESNDSNYGDSKIGIKKKKKPEKEPEKKSEHEKKYIDRRYVTQIYSFKLE
ncbi:1954_t:CDS:2, partial [Dentiscutata heterogama]